MDNQKDEGEECKKSARWRRADSNNVGRLTVQMVEKCVDCLTETVEDREGPEKNKNQTKKKKREGHQGTQQDGESFSEMYRLSVSHAFGLILTKINQLNRVPG